jgi:hypothetical protein
LGEEAVQKIAGHTGPLCSLLQLSLGDFGRVWTGDVRERGTQRAQERLDG